MKDNPREKLKRAKLVAITAQPKPGKTYLEMVKAALMGGAEVILTKTEGSLLKITTKGKGFIVPQLNHDQIRAKVLGRTLTQATSILSGLPNISSYRIEHFPNLGSLSFMPLRPEALKLEVEKMFDSSATFFDHPCEEPSREDCGVPSHVHLQRISQA